MNEADKMQPDLRQSRTDSEKNAWTSILNAVQTPLSFFVLVVLVVEVILGLTTNSSNGTDKTFLVVGLLALIFLLVLIVAGMALYRPESLWGKIRQINDANQRPTSSYKVINQPRVLWASSLPASQPLEDSLYILRKKFPKSVAAKSDLTSREFLDLLTKEKFDIVQLTATVRKDGCIEFGTDDVITGGVLADYLNFHDTQLLILLCCDAIPLAVKLSARISMIAATGNIPNHILLKWQVNFYEKLLKGEPLSAAYRFVNHKLERLNYPPILLMMWSKVDIQFGKQPDIHTTM